MQAKCDLCGSTISPYCGYHLFDSYQVPGEVEDVCGECHKECSKAVFASTKALRKLDSRIRRLAFWRFASSRREKYDMPPLTEELGDE